MRTASTLSASARIEPSFQPPRATSANPLLLAHATLTTPVGDVQLFASERGLLSIALPNESRAEAMRRLWRAHGPLDIIEWTDASDASERLASDVPAYTMLSCAMTELRAYFDDPAAARRPFTVPLDLRGTPFQCAAWLAVAEIPSGETRTYSEIAQAIGRPTAVRAVGAANGANPIPIVIPCHRVVGADGALTGYGGGLPMKRWLLDYEGA